MSAKLSQLRGYFTEKAEFQQQKKLEQLISDISILEQELEDIELNLSQNRRGIQACEQYLQRNTPLIVTRQKIIKDLIRNAKTDSARLIQEEKFKQCSAPLIRTEVNLQKYKNIENDLLSEKMIVTEAVDNKRIQFQAFFTMMGPDNIDASLLEKVQSLIGKIVEDVKRVKMPPAA